MNTEDITNDTLDATAEWLVDELIAIVLTGPALTVDMPEGEFRAKRAAMLEDTREIVYALVGRGGKS